MAGYGVDGKPPAARETPSGLLETMFPPASPGAMKILMIRKTPPPTLCHCRTRSLPTKNFPHTNRLILEVARDRDECSGLGGWARRESLKTLDRGAGEVILRSSYTTEREGHASGDSSTAGLIYFTLKLILF